MSGNGNGTNPANPTHEIYIRPITELIPYARNPRRNDPEVDRMCASIQEFGFKLPVLIRSNGQVIDGHLRLKAAHKLGMTEVPVMLCDEWTEAQVKAFRLLVNRSASWASFDTELLSLELLDLQGLDFDLNLTGFDPDEISGFLTQGGGTAGLTDPDDVPEAPEQPITVLGDMWVLGKHRLLCGDSTNIDAVELLMDGEKADMVFTDPPYGIALIKDESGKVGGGTKEYPTSQFRQIIGDNKDFDPQCIFGYSDQMIVWGGNYFADRLPSSRCWFVWDKKHPVDRTFCGCELAWTSLDRHAKVYDSTWDGWTKEGESGSKVHPSQKPIKLLADILGDTTKESSVILDLFGGSGSTLIACEKTGRTARLMEIDPRYVDVTIRRWEAFTGNHATLEDGRTFAAVSAERKKQQKVQVTPDQKSIVDMAVAKVRADEQDDTISEGRAVELIVGDYLAS